MGRLGMLYSVAAACNIEGWLTLGAGRLGKRLGLRVWLEYKVCTEAFD